MASSINKYGHESRKIWASPNNVAARETQDKESQRWLDGLAATQQLIAQDIQVMTSLVRQSFSTRPD